MLCRGLLRIKRKEGDSNPRRVAPCLISNQVPSTSRPSFQLIQKMLPGGLEPPRPQQTLAPEASASTKFRHDSKRAVYGNRTRFSGLGSPLNNRYKNTAKNKGTRIRTLAGRRLFPSGSAATHGPLGHPFMEPTGLEPATFRLRT